ncbi:MAG: PEGA domain-containing protein [Myxococcaceae bacterium]|nr:PEGA domain-containing protein [Myxococcaceae bacterium]
MRRSRNRVLDAALSGLLVGLLAVGPAFAQQSPERLLPPAPPAAAAPKLTVVVVPLDAPARAQVPRLTYLAEQAVRGAGRFSLVRLVDALDPQGASIREAKAQAATAAFQEGVKAYDELDTQKALQQFDKAAQTYEGSDLSLHFEEMSRARVMKIASYVANGDNKAFLRELKEVLARNPRAEFSPNYFPPDELAIVEKTRKAILAEANRTLLVRTGEVIAQVFVDGQFQGPSPVTLSSLTSAEHFVTIIAPGYKPAQGRVRGEASFTLQPVPTELRLRALVEQIANEPEGPGRDAALKELGALAGTQQVLAVLVRATPSAAAQDLIALRLDVSDGHNLGYATAPVPSMGEAMDAALQGGLTRVLQADAPRMGGPVRHFASAKAGPGRRTAGYVLIATGAALVAGGFYFGLEASSRSSRFKETPQTSPRAEQLRSDGKTFALIADLGILAGLVSAGAGSWLAFSGSGGDGKTQARPSRSAPPPGPPPARETPPPSRPADASVTAPQDTPAAAPQDTPVAAPQDTPAAPPREEAPKRGQAARREEAAKREEAERLKREEEQRRKREEERRKREEEGQKKRRPLDEDDLRNY